MSVSIEGFSKAQDASDDPKYLQYIPAKVSYEGRANVKSFFNDFTVRKETEENTPFTNVFRGRPLDGKSSAEEIST